MTIASNHTQACFEAWINCENMLVNLARLKTSISKKITKVIDECAFICLGTFNALKSRSVNAGRLAVLCMGICEECAEICETLNEETFTQCAKACRKCSESMSEIAFR